MTEYDYIGPSATDQNLLYVKYKSVCNTLILQFEGNI